MGPSHFVEHAGCRLSCLSRCVSPDLMSVAGGGINKTKHGSRHFSNHSHTLNSRFQRSKCAVRKLPGTTAGESFPSPGSLNHNSATPTVNGIPACLARAAHTSFHTLLPLAVLLMCQVREPATVPHPSTAHLAPCVLLFTVSVHWHLVVCLYSTRAVCVVCIQFVYVLRKRNPPKTHCICCVCVSV